MGNMERFTPLYAIAYDITNSMENLRFDKEGYFHVLVFYELFYKRNRKHFFPCSHTVRYRNNRGSMGGLEIAWKFLNKNTAFRQSKLTFSKCYFIYKSKQCLQLYIFIRVTVQQEYCAKEQYAV